MKKAVLLLSVILIAGCGGAGTEPPVSEAPPPDQVQEAELPVPAPEPEPEPMFRIENIVGLSPHTVEEILGPAQVVRREKDARVWMYKNSNCVVHLYFYENELGDMVLDYVDTMAADLSAPNPTVSGDACLDSLVVKRERLPQAPARKVSPQSPSSVYSDTDPQPGTPDN